jgi:hypothetical protein
MNIRRIRQHRKHLPWTGSNAAAENATDLLTSEPGKDLCFRTGRLHNRHRCVQVRGTESEMLWPDTVNGGPAI